MSQEKKNNLFNDDTTNIYSLDEQEISIDDNDQNSENPSKEKRFGTGNLVMLFVILLLAATTIYFMVFANQTDSTGETSKDSHTNSNSINTDSDSPQDIESSSSSAEENIEISEPNEESGTDTSVPDQEQPDPPKEPTFHGMIQNNMGYTYLYYGIAVEQFNGSDKTLNRYTEALAAIQDKLPETASIYHLPIPTHIGFLNEKIDISIKREDDFYNSSQKDFIEKLATTQKDKINVIDVYQTLYEHYQAGDKLYFNTDANWTSSAAYLAYRAFCEARTITPVELEQYTQYTIDNFLGSYYRATEHEELAANADTFVYYSNDYIDACTLTVYNNGSTYKKYKLCNNATSTETAYLTYLGTNAGHYKLETPLEEKRTLLVIGDGSTAAMMPYLVNHYSEIHYIDVANYNGTIETFLSEHSTDDVLFACYLTNAVKGDYPNDFKNFSGVNNDE